MRYRAGIYPGDPQPADTRESTLTVTTMQSGLVVVTGVEEVEHYGRKEEK